MFDTMEGMVIPPYRGDSNSYKQVILECGVRTNLPVSVVSSTIVRCTGFHRLKLKR